MWLPASDAYQTFAVGRRGDAVRATTFGVVEDLDLAARLIKPPVDTGLPGEPERPGGIEDGGVQVRARPVRRERERTDLVGLAVDPDDRVETAVGDPGRTVRPGDDSVGRRTGTQRDLSDVAGRRIEVTEDAVALPRVPDAAIRGRRHVVWVRAGRHVELADRERDRSRLRARGCRCARAGGRGRRGQSRGGRRRDAVRRRGRQRGRRRAA